ncbi:MAG: SRPBCC domain-containing protein [Actinomycetota bacterium]|nr:SRPBCC domain-containing protein [Actinomycetota bacterium]
MRVEQTFTVPEARERVWRFFETEVERVTRCIPGVESFEDLGEDRYRVRITQKVGSIGATFDLKARLDRKDPMNAFEFSAVGRSVKGAAGDMRSKNRLNLAEAEGGRTTLTVTSDVALGGMLGSLGYRVVVSKTRDVTDQFVHNVTESMREWSSQDDGGSGEEAAP